MAWRAFFALLRAERRPLQARPEGREHFDHVLNKIVRDFGFFHDDELPSLRGKRGLNITRRRNASAGRGVPRPAPPPWDPPEAGAAWGDGHSVRNRLQTPPQQS